MCSHISCALNHSEPCICECVFVCASIGCVLSHTEVCVCACVVIDCALSNSEQVCVSLWECMSTGMGGALNQLGVCVCVCSYGLSIELLRCICVSVVVPQTVHLITVSGVCVCM